MSWQVTDFEREEERASGRAVRLSGTGHERDGVLPVPVPSQWPQLASPPRADGGRGERGYAHRAAGLHLPAHDAQARQSSARKTWSRHKTCQLRRASWTPITNMNVAYHSSCFVLCTVDYDLPAKHRRCLSQAGGSPSEGSKGARGTGFRMTTMRARVCEGDDKRHTSRRPAPSPHERPLCILSARAARHLLVVMLA
jgi:hypothetical protein